MHGLTSGRVGCLQHCKKQPAADIAGQFSHRGWLVTLHSMYMCLWKSAWSVPRFFHCTCLPYVPPPPSSLANTVSPHLPLHCNVTSQCTQSAATHSATCLQRLTRSWHLHLPTQVPYSLGDEQLPDDWACKDNAWDAGHANCGVPQELSNQEIDAILALQVGRVGASPGGLSCMASAHHGPALLRSRACSFV